MSAKKLLLIVLALTMCASCTLNQHSRSLRTGMKAKAMYNNSASGQLAEAAASISTALTELKKIEQSVHPSKEHIQPPEPASYGMGDLASVDWSGPVEPVLHQLAQSTQYTLKVMGNAPAIPILITVYAHQKPLGEILRNIGYQCGNKADVVVFPGNRSIELRYNQPAMG